MTTVRFDESAACVGIWWATTVDDMIYHATPVEDVEPDSLGFVNDPNSHVVFWNTVRRLRPEKKFMEYSDTPRGRVIFNSKTRLFTIYGPTKQLKDKELCAELLRVFQLPDTTVFTPDRHYDP